MTDGTLATLEPGHRFPPGGGWGRRRGTQAGRGRKGGGGGASLLEGKIEGGDEYKPRGRGIREKVGKRGWCGDGSVTEMNRRSKCWGGVAVRGEGGLFRGQP